MTDDEFPVRRIDGQELSDPVEQGSDDRMDDPAIEQARRTEPKPEAPEEVHEG